MAPKRPQSVPPTPSLAPETSDYLDTREQKGDNAVNSPRDLSPPLLINLKQT